MAVCKECEYYNLIDGVPEAGELKAPTVGVSKGNCFGHEVLADMSSEKCPLKAFEPKAEEGVV